MLCTSNIIAARTVDSRASQMAHEVYAALVRKNALDAAKD